MQSDDVIRFDSYGDVRSALFNKDLARIGETDFHAFIQGNILEDALISLHGKFHQQRRKAETHLFSRDHRTAFERDLLPALLDQITGDSEFEPKQDLLTFARQVAVVLAAATAGIDLDVHSRHERLKLADLARTFAEGAGIEDSLRGFDAVRQDVQESLRVFDEGFFASSWDRRLALIEKGETVEDDLLFTLMSHAEELGLTKDIIRRETGLFLAAGTDTTAQSLTSLINNVFEWCEDHPDDWDRLVSDLGLLQRFFHETLRVRPVLTVTRRRAVADTQVGDTAVPAGSKVLLDLYAASCDPTVYGENAERFDPYRTLPEGGASFGFAFSSGIHSCIGKSLAGGAPLPAGESVPDDHLFGTVTVFARHLFKLEISPDHSAEGTKDSDSIRWTKWLRFPVIFNARSGAEV